MLPGGCRAFATGNPATPCRRLSMACLAAENQEPAKPGATAPQRRGAKRAPTQTAPRGGVAGVAAGRGGGGHERRAGP